MKKITLLLVFISLTGIVRAQSNWVLSLNQILPGQPANLGTKNAYPVNFFVNNTQWMTLGINGLLKVNTLAGTGNRFLQTDSDGNLMSWTGNSANVDKVLYGNGEWRLGPILTSGTNLYTNTGTKFGIGLSSPTEALDVTGSGQFSGDVKVAGLVKTKTLQLSDHLIVECRASTALEPKVISIRDVLDPQNPGTSKYFKMCNIFNSKTNEMETPLFQTANTFEELIQVHSVPVSDVFLNLGVNNGDGIVAVEPAAGAEGTTGKLRLNPGCTSDVLICEGGGFTKVFGDAAVLSELHIGPESYSTNDSQLGVVVSDYVPKGITVLNPLISSANKTVFQITKTGQAILGQNLNGTTTSMLTIGQSAKSAPALALVDNGSVGQGRSYFSVYGDGYTEIKVYSPNSINASSGRVFSIKDVNRDLFLVKADGKVFAREVEISLATAFPDYVFGDNYKLKPLSELAGYIATNKHLPGFETGAYYEKNGVNVSEILVKQQEKIEELTLYILEMEKRLKTVEEAKNKN